MKDEHHEILARIDERTHNIERRQTEEILRLDKFHDRLSVLENFKNYMVGAWALAGFALTMAFSYIEERLTTHHGR